MELTFKDEKYLHIYAQQMPHHESFIVGNKEALLELREMINEALKEEESERYFTSSDGEGYQAFVIKIPDDEVELFESLEMPYTMQYGDVNSNIFFVNSSEKPNEPYSPVTLLHKINPQTKKD